MQEKLDQLKQHLARAIDLRYAASLLTWDQETYMPGGGARSRADQLGTLWSLSHRYLVSEEVGELLEELSAHLDKLDPASDEAGIIRVNKRDYERESKIPTSLVEEIARTGSLTKQAWREARTKDDFSIFAPLLEKTVDLQRQWVNCFDPVGNPYDRLLDRFEPGMNSATAEDVFTGLKPGLIRLAQAISEKEGAVDASVLDKTLSDEKQIAFSRDITAILGYDYDRGRLDLSAHPFTIRFPMNDVRITTRLMPDNPVKALMSSIHEAGHAMHAQSIDPALYRTGLDIGNMMAIGESQSRFYENVIGRSRAFWKYLYPRFQAAFAPAFDDVGLDSFYAALNEVKPGLIRVEADEVTYGLHIVLRFELENALINGQIEVADLPGMWNERMKTYLGLVPPTDADGVMQDIHWSQGAFGYFPDYLLGSIFAVQLWDRMQADHPTISEQIEAGQFEQALAWLKEKVMQHGRKFTLPELAERTLGGPLRWEPYLAYLETKYGEIYGL